MLVHQQQLAVVAVQIIQPPAPAQRVVKAKLHAGCQQPEAQGFGKRQAAIGIEQTAHPHLTRRGALQRLDHDFSALPGLNQIKLQINVILRLLDSRQHLRKKLRAIDQ